ncbi:uncharacterized protein N7487_004711 [Penicillium crustosum]|uniref:uncharacterized protein n=1 Tax=Penicillium crustosum TaxID=36656 RepID=UPI0023A6194D|nr:uncharacterized protein N7487_004711 [Penicillium crustosum]KAJ5410352.1 hypothetical protein N7487_004711 [Penicillium crustosum]
MVIRSRTRVIRAVLCEARFLMDRHRPRRNKAEQQDGALKGAFAVFHISIPENYRDKLVETDDRGKSDRR